MSGKQPVEVLLRPAVELYTVAACAGAAFLCLVAPWSLALSPAMGIGSALAFGAYGAIRYRDARIILRYRRNIRRLPRYVMTSKDVPVSQQRLFVGRGFLWEQKHTHRLMQTYRPEFRRYVEPTPAYRLTRRLEERLEFAPLPLSRLPKLTGWDAPFNPVRPLPPVGGLPRLHGIEPDEVDVSLPLGERVGHSLVLGTTRVGKTRLAELFVTQDIRRRNAAGEHEVVIVIDPKGDADLLKRMYVEAQRAGREGEFYIFHLGWPEISARYNAVGRFGRISEVATRIAGQLSGEGNSAAFREFAWRFVNIIARALVELGQRPDYMLIQRHVINIDALFIEYAQHYFAKTEPKAWEVIVQIEAKLNEKNIPTTRRTSTRSSHRCCRCWKSSRAARSPSSWRRTTPTWPTRARSSTGCRSSESGPSSMWVWMRCLTPRSPQRSAIRCSLTWFRWPDTSTSTESTMACPAQWLALACRSTCTRTNSMN